jgi:hypothetical protein
MGTTDAQTRRWRRSAARALSEARNASSIADRSELDRLGHVIGMTLPPALHLASAGRA